jgi:hypothetical protein
MAVMASVTVWYWVAPFSAKPGLAETGKGYAVVSVYKNSSNNGCTALDIQNKGTNSITNLLMYIRDYNTGKPAGFNGTDPTYPAYVNVTVINRGDTVHFNLSVGGQAVASSGNFTETNISNPGALCAVDVGDSDNNGKNDVVVTFAAYGTGNNLRMYENKTGGWPETNIGIQPYGEPSVAVGDGDNDGKNEVFTGIMFGAGVSNHTRLYKNTSGTWVETNISDFGSNAVGTVAIGDANNDGSNELVNSAYASIYLSNKTGGVWVVTDTGCSAGTNIQGLDIGDADNNGKKDELRTCENKSGTWVTTNIADVNNDPSGVYSVAVGDADNDGKNEVVIGMYDGDGNYTRIYKNTTGKWVETNLSNVGRGGSVAIGDADNDGGNEIVLVSDISPQLRMYKYTGGQWAETNVSSPPSVGGGFTIVIKDANNDGNNDIVVVMDSGTNTVRMYTKVSNSSSSPSIPLGTYILRASAAGFSDFIFTCS